MTRSVPDTAWVKPSRTVERVRSTASSIVTASAIDASVATSVERRFQALAAASRSSVAALIRRAPRD